MPIVILAIAVLISIVSLGLLIWAIIDIAKADFPGQGKLIWLLVVFFGGLIGVIVYFAVGRSQKIPPASKTDSNPFAGS